MPPPNTLPPTLVANVHVAADRDRQRVKLKHKDARNAREAEKKKRVAQLAKTRENPSQALVETKEGKEGLPALLPEPETSAFWAVAEVRKPRRVRWERMAGIQRGAPWTRDRRRTSANESGNGKMKHARVGDHDQPSLPGRERIPSAPRKGGGMESSGNT